MSDDDVAARFDKAVNMTAGELEKWLQTDDSKQSGQHKNGGHLAQRPKGDVEHTTWRYSLMNWGHDPMK